MTDDELREFVTGFCDGRLFTSAQMAHPERDLPVVFMPLAMGAFKDFPPEYIADIGVLWEWLDQQGPRSVNGMPTFLSLRIMHKDDWARAHKAIAAEFLRRKDIKV